MPKLVGMMLLVIGSAAIASAQALAPEIDTTSTASALVLLGGVVLVIRANRRK
jgi:hypothetical protein